MSRELSDEEKASYAAYLEALKAKAGPNSKRKFKRLTMREYKEWRDGRDRAEMTALELATQGPAAPPPPKAPPVYAPPSVYAATLNGPPRHETGAIMPWSGERL